jgi:SRSO17 transposase
MDSIAIMFEGVKKVRNLGHFITDSPYDDQAMLEKYEKLLFEFLSGSDLMVTLDGTDHPKQGTHSVGVARQYCGQTGKVDNCQSSVVVGLAGENGYGLLRNQLFLPERWFDDDHATARLACRVPVGLKFVSKIKMAIEMIRKAYLASKGAITCAGFDSWYGKSSELLDAIGKYLTYFADIPKNLLVFPSRRSMKTPQYSGTGRKPNPRPTIAPVNVENFAYDENIPWVHVVIGNGAKGPIVAYDKCIKVVEVRNAAPGKDVWLYIRKLEDGKIKYALCNAAMDASNDELRKLAQMRWSIEQCFGECKDYLGMGDYELRTWRGWHRHMLFTNIAHLFINKLRREFSLTVEPDSPLKYPIVEAPVSVDDYCKAVKQVQNNEPIDHPDITVLPKKPQQVLTIGIIKRAIRPYLERPRRRWDEVKFMLKSAAGAYQSHTKKQILKLMGEISEKT